MQVGMDIALWLDVPQWLLQVALGGGCGHWELAWAWLDISLSLTCY
jgi:hypothetical protein